MKRRILSTALSGLGISSALLALRQLTHTPWLTVLTYHRVHPGPSVEAVDAGVVAVTPETFDRQLAMLARRFDVVSVERVVEAASGGALLPRSPVLITFDDGYRDNYDVALPLLRKHGLTATFFIATQFVDERRLFWWDRVNYVLKASRLEKVELEYPNKSVLALGPTPAHRASAIKAALRIVKGHFGLNVTLFLEHLADAAGVRFDRAQETKLANEHIMTWPEVRALHEAGMSVQSHTHSHRVLDTLTKEDLDDELVRSRYMLEAALGHRVSAIAYPVGKTPSCSRTIRDAVYRAGYALAFSNRTGVNPVASFDEHDAKRIAIDTSISDAWFEAIMAVPALAHQ